MKWKRGLWVAFVCLAGGFILGLFSGLVNASDVLVYVLGGLYITWVVVWGLSYIFYEDRFIYRGPVLGIGPGRRRWYSICSKLHGNADPHVATPGCEACHQGEYVYDLNQAVSDFVYKRSPRLWRFWANRPWRRKEVVERAFPRLRRQDWREWWAAR